MMKQRQLLTVLMKSLIPLPSTLHQMLILWETQQFVIAIQLPAITGTNLTGNESYFDGPGGTGNALNPGDAITTAGANTLYIYDATGTTPDCFDEETFVVTVNITPIITPQADVTECGSYTLPAIPGTNLTGNESYYDGPNGTGNAIAAGTDITTLGANTIYVYDETASVPNCTSVDTLIVTINFSPIIDPSADATECDTYTLPAITGTNMTGNESYYTGSMGTGSPMNAGDAITTAGTTTLYIYDETGTVPNCFDEDTINITINISPNAGIDNSQTLCNTAGTTFDLSTILDPAADAGGTWSETSAAPSGQFTGSTLDASGLAEQDYTFIYVVNGTAPCVNDTAVFTVTVTGIIFAGADNATTLCNTVGATLDLNTLVDPTADAGGTWAETTGTPSGQFTAFTGILDVSGLSASAYTFTYTLAASGSCPGDDATFTVTINETPIITPSNGCYNV